MPIVSTVATSYLQLRGLDEQLAVGREPGAELADDGRIAAHVDYWDSDSAFMTKIPVAGLFIKALRSQMAIKT